MEDYIPVYGRTYSLFGGEEGTLGFYRRLSGLLDDLLPQFEGTEEQFLQYILQESREKQKLRRISRGGKGDPELTLILRKGSETLSQYLCDVEGFIRSVGPFRRMTDRELLTGREQYILHMVEFGLMNRLNIDRFNGAAFRIALLPYCLKENQEECRAEPDEYETRCRHCIKTCYVNRISRILRERDIHPYILSQGRVGKLLATLRARFGSIGVLGIACIVELIWGMRLCMEAGVPAVGIPLNANRCPRWMGSMYSTSVDIGAIERLLSGRHDGEDSNTEETAGDFIVH